MTLPAPIWLFLMLLLEKKSYKRGEGKVRKLMPYLWTDIQRTFFSKRFLISVLLIPVLDFISAANETLPLMDGFQMLDRIDTFGLCLFIYVIYTIPYAYSYCADTSNRFIFYSLIRGSKMNYVRSKIIACALGGGCAAFLGRLSTICLFSFKMPLWNGGGGNGDEFFYEMADHGEVWNVFLIILVLNSLKAAVLAVSAFMISTYIPNIFLAAASPIVCYSLFVNIIGAFTYIPWLSIDRIYSVYGEVFPTAGGTLFYAIFVTVVLIYGMEKLSSRAIIRRLYNE